MRFVAGENGRNYKKILPRNRDRDAVGAECVAACATASLDGKVIWFNCNVQS